MLETGALNAKQLRQQLEARVNQTTIVVAAFPAAGSQVPEAILLRAMEGRIARAAVRRLPDEQRQAVGLAFWGGLSAQELATVEGIPLGTAKSRIRLGLAKLSCDPALAAA